MRIETTTDLLESRSRECSDGRVDSLQMFRRGPFVTYNDTFQSDVSRQMIQGWHLRVFDVWVIKELTVDGRYLFGYVISLMIMMIFKAKSFSIFDLLPETVNYNYTLTKWSRKNNKEPNVLATVSIKWHHNQSRQNDITKKFFFKRLSFHFYGFLLF